MKNRRMKMPQASDVIGICRRLSGCLRRLAGLGLGFLSLFLLASCVDAEVAFRFNQDGSGTMRIEYSVSSLVEYVRSGETALIALPTTAVEFEQIVRASSGIQAQELEIDESGGRFHLDGTLRFQDSLAVERFYRACTGYQLTITSEGNSRSMEVELPFSDEYQEIVTKLPQGLRLYYDTHAIELSVQSEEAILTASPGLVEDDRALFSIATLDYAETLNPIIWRVEMNQASTQD